MNSAIRLAVLAAFGSLLAACAPAPVERTAQGEMDPSTVERIHKVWPGVDVVASQSTPVPGYQEMRLAGGNYAYRDPSGRYLFVGDVVDLQTGQRLTEDSRRQLRESEVAAVADTAIRYPAAGKTLGRLTVVTDVDCAFCRRFHQEVPKLNADGIEVDYIFMPRSGPDTPSFTKAEAVWCAPDQRAAMTAAKAGQATPPIPADCHSPVMRQYQAARAMGIEATPALLLPDGSVQYGYQGEAQLMTAMGIR